jgi:hypothetical protein
MAKCWGIKVTDSSKFTKRNWLGAIVIALSGTAQIGFAATSNTAQAYHCSIDARGPGGFTPSEMVFRFVKNGSSVVVLDRITERETGGPITAAVKTRSQSVKRFRWSFSVGVMGGGKIVLSYRVDFDPAKLSGKIKTSHTGFAGEPLGGILSCEPYNGNLV